MNSKRSLVISLALAVTILPSSAMAQSDNSRSPKSTPSPSSETNAQYCAKITNRYNTLNEKVTKLKSTTNEKKAQVKTSLSQQRAKADQQLLEKQQTWDQTQNQQFEQLEKLAETEAQKEAVTTFSIAVRNAVEIRRTSVKTALSTYRTAVDQLREQNQVQGDTALATRQQEVKAAFDKAAADCAANITPAEVKTQLFANLKTAETKYKNSRKTAEKFNVSLEPLKAARKTAIDQANATFKATVEAARAEMKGALLEIEPTPTATPSPISTTTPTSTSQPVQ